MGEVNFLEECKRCGHKCCQRNPLFFLSDVERIKELFDGLEFEEVEEDYYILKNEVFGSCFFLKEGICVLQDIKPINCRAYPLMYKFNEDGKLRWFFSDFCPVSGKVSRDFINKGIKLYLSELLKGDGAG